MRLRRIGAPSLLSPAAFVRCLLADRRGSSELTVHLLLMAAGAVMVGLTVPSLFSSSNSASRTFQNQVNVLERGADPSGGSGGAGGGTNWSFSFGSGGVTASLNGGGVSATFQGGGSGGGVTGSVSSGNGSQSGGGSGSGQPLTGAQQSLNAGQGSLLNAIVH